MEWEKFVNMGHCEFKELKYQDALAFYNKAYSVWSWVKCAKPLSAPWTDADVSYTSYACESLDEKSDYKDIVTKTVNNIGLVYIKMKQFGEAIYALDHLIYSLGFVNPKSYYLKYLALYENPSNTNDMYKTAERYLLKSMEHEVDPDKLKVLRDKLFKLRSEMNKNSRRRRMGNGRLMRMRGGDGLETVKEDLDTSIDSLNKRVHGVVADIYEINDFKNVYDTLDNLDEYNKGKSARDSTDKGLSGADNDNVLDKANYRDRVSQLNSSGTEFNIDSIDSYNSNSIIEDYIQTEKADLHRSNTDVENNQDNHDNKDSEKVRETSKSEASDSIEHERKEETLLLKINKNKEMPPIKLIQDRKYKLKQEINECSILLSGLKKSSDNKKVTLVTELLKEYNSKYVQLCTMYRERKCNLLNSITKPEPEVLKRVKVEYDLDLNDAADNSILRELYDRNISAQGIINKYKQYDRSVSFGQARVYEYEEEVYDKVYKRGFLEINSGSIKLLFFILILYLAIYFGLKTSISSKDL